MYALVLDTALLILSILDVAFLFKFENADSKLEIPVVFKAFPEVISFKFSNAFIVVDTSFKNSLLLNVIDTILSSD